MDKQKIVSAIYDLSEAKSASQVHEILSRFKAVPVSTEQINENLEDVIQAAVDSLLDLLRKAALVSGEDNNILQIDTDEEEEKEPWETRVQVPPPPGTIDPNETGIPDNSQKTQDVPLSEQIFDNPDEPPYINERPYPFQIGDYVSWAGPLGRSYGRIEDIRLDGVLPIVDSPLGMLATYDDPVCLTRTWRIDNGQGGWLPTDTVIPLKMSGLHKIDPLEPPPPIAPTMPNTQKNLEATIIAKGLKVKTSGTQLRGLFTAVFKEADPGSYALTTEDTSLIGAEWIPDGSIVRDIVAADLLEDRGFERFLRKGLEDLAVFYPKKPMLLDHEWSAHQIVGKVLKAFVRDGQLILRAYFPNTDKNKWVVDAIKSSMFTMVSVGFAASPEDMVCSACGKSMFDSGCKHQPGDVLKDGSRVNLLYTGVADAFECSIIPVPMQPGAHILPAGKALNTPSDTIPLGTSTIGNSKLSDNLSGIAPVGTEAAQPTVQDLSLMPGAAVDPPASGTLAELTSAAPADVALAADAPPAAPATEAKDLDSPTPDIAKMVGELRSVSEGAYVDMHCKMDKIAETATDIQAKADKMLSSFATDTAKSVENEAALGEMLKSLNDKVEKLDAALTASVDREKKFEAAQEEYKTSLADLHKKLDIAMTASTEGVMKLLLEDNVPQAPRTQAKKNIWVHDFFGQKDDQGGQS